MNEVEASIRVFLIGLALLLALVVLVYVVNQLTYLATGQPLVVLFEDGSVQVLGRYGGCLLEAWGCTP